MLNESKKSSKWVYISKKIEIYKNTELYTKDTFKCTIYVTA